jgi:hypothetical protein
LEKTFGGGLRFGHLLEAREELEVLARREPGVMGRALRHPADLRRAAMVSVAHGDPPSRGRERPGQDGKQGRFPRAVRPDEGESVAPPHLERRGRQRDGASVGARDAFGCEKRTVLRRPSYGDHPTTSRC